MCPSLPASQAVTQCSVHLTLDVEQREVRVAGSFRYQAEVEAVPTLGLIPVNHADGLDELRGEERADGDSGRREKVPPLPPQLQALSGTWPGLASSHTAAS